MTMALLLALSASVRAQYVTYNHDESVQNQVTIQEIGSGSFTRLARAISYRSRISSSARVSMRRSS